MPSLASHARQNTHPESHPIHRFKREFFAAETVLLTGCSDLHSRTVAAWTKLQDRSFAQPQAALRVSYKDVANELPAPNKRHLRLNQHPLAAT